MSKVKTLLSILFMSILIAFSSCQKRHDDPLKCISNGDKKWLEEFFNDVFFDESAIYTLWGSKPITAFDVSYYSEQELAEIREKYPPPEGDIAVEILRYTLPENLKQWETIQSRLSMPNYRFFKIQDSLFPKIYRLFFVSIINLQATLLEHQQLFTDKLGFNFDPIEVSLDIENPQSPFWKSVFRSGELMGILYGFGLDNSKQFCLDIQHTKSVGFSAQTDYTTDTNVTNFTIPIFASYSENDPIIQRYLNEKELIKDVYRDKSVVKATLDRLTSDYKLFPTQ